MAASAATGGTSASTAAAAERRLYLGSMLSSLGYLPQWYQAMALSGVLFVIYQRDNPVVRWLVVQLHSSLGTDDVWYPKYQEALECMTFNERVCFTLYGVSLALVSALVYKIFCQDSYGFGAQSSQLFPDRRAYTVVLGVLMFAVKMVELRHIIETLVLDNPLVQLALNDFAAIESSSYDPRLAESNKHFIIQLELLKAVASQFVHEYIPVVFVAGIYRLIRDVPRRLHSSLRWYMATVCYVCIIMIVVRMYVKQDTSSPSDWAVLAWGVAYTCLLNFVYGPSQRCGMVETATTANAAKQAIRGLNACGAMWALSMLSVIAVLVSVHVVELISIWLLIALLTVWLPAIVDSCAFNYVVVLSAAASYVGSHMGYLNGAGDNVRFAMMLVLWWVNVCLIYNAIVNVTRIRYAGVGILLWLGLWVLMPRDSDVHQTRDGVDVVTLASARLQWLAEVANYEPLTGVTWLSGDGALDSADVFRRIITSGIGTLVGLLAIITFVGTQQSEEVRVKMRRQHIPLVSFTVFSRKAIKTVVQVICVLSFVLSSWSFERYVLPLIDFMLPGIVARVISGVIACVVLGVFSDMKEFIYECLMRLLGLMDPPAASADDTERGTMEGTMDGDY